MTMNLMLVGIRKVEFKDGEVKYKHIFLSDRGKTYIGWSDNDQLKGDIFESDTFDQSRAHAREVEIDSKNDLIAYKVRL